MDPVFWLAEVVSKDRILSSKQWTSVFLITFQYNPEKAHSTLRVTLQGEQDGIKQKCFHFEKTKCQNKTKETKKHNTQYPTWYTEEEDFSASRQKGRIEEIPWIQKKARRVKACQDCWGS